VNQLIDLAKAEAGRLEPDIMSVHLQGLFADLRGSLRPVVPPSVRLDIPDVADIPAIDTDPVLLGQVLRNLLTNALKFTSDGSVTMTVSVRESRQHVEIEVTDTGVGIAAEELHAIFEEFHQIKGAHQLAQRGTGLGLPYARRLTEILGGSLVVTSEEGVGSTFTVRLPIHAMSAAEAPGPSESVPMLDSVLVADDDDAFREVMRSMLQGLATRVVEARDGEAALAAATAARPDLVFVDLRMPGMDGSDVLIRMAEHPMLHDVPVVVVTSVPLHMAAVSFGPNPPRLVAKEELTPELVRSLVAAASSASAGAA